MSRRASLARKGLRAGTVLGMLIRDGATLPTQDRLIVLAVGVLGRARLQVLADLCGLMPTEARRAAERLVDAGWLQAIELDAERERGYAASPTVISYVRSCGV